MFRVLTLLPPPLWHFLGTKKALPAHQFFLSFEDALWSLLSNFDIDGKTVLYPSFFCTDVVNRLDMRGAICVPYNLTRNLEVDKDSLLGAILQYSPSVVFLYHPLGLRVPSSLIDEVIYATRDEALVIEDCADILLSPDEIELKGEKHIIIDSLRKVSPLQGARVFSSKKRDLVGQYFSHYATLVLLYYISYRIFHLLGTLLHSRALLNACWHLFGHHSNLIGASAAPNFGFAWDRRLADYLDTDAIRKGRIRICSSYDNEIKNKISLNPFQITIPEIAYDSLRFYPLVFNKGIGDKVASKLEKFSIYIDSHFNDSPHCEQMDYLLLPIWHTMTEQDVERIVNRVEYVVKGLHV